MAFLTAKRNPLKLSIASRSGCYPMMKVWFLWLVCLPCLAWSELLVVYPAPESPNDRRFNDLIEILNGALMATEDDYGPFRMESAQQPMTSMRYAQELMAGRTPNVIWTSTSREREAALTPIRIPLRKGLLSYRLGFIDASQQAHFDRIQHIQDLQQLTLVQGVGWGDIQILEANDIRVLTAPYESLFQMVTTGRAHYFPRGVGEIFEEYERRRDDQPALAVESGLLLYYPWPYYFFVNKENTHLAERLETGLRRMIADGSFDDIFWRFNGNSIERAQLHKRRIIELENHLLPEATPLNDDSLWFKIEAR